MKTLATALVLALLSPLTTFAAIKTATIDYKDGDLTCKGYLAYDDAVPGPRPGVLVVPEWWGLTEYPQERAKQLAGLGYVAFVADMYGNGKTTDDAKEAGGLAMPLKGDPAKFRARGDAALKAFRDVGPTTGGLDPSKVAAIGYCFGGSAVLELARAGENLAGVVSFHGGLSTPAPAKPGDVKAKILVCHGGDDPMVKPAELEGFKKEMADAKVDPQVVVYPGAMHAFSNPDADRHNIPGIKYNEKADKESFEAMKAFLADVFKK